MKSNRTADVTGGGSSIACGSSVCAASVGSTPSSSSASSAACAPPPHAQQAFFGFTSRHTKFAQALLDVSGLGGATKKAHVAT